MTRLKFHQQLFLRSMLEDGAFDTHAHSETGSRYDKNTFIQPARSFVVIDDQPQRAVVGRHKL